MTALDTNVIVRFLVRDDERQAQAVYRRFKQAENDRETLFIPLLVLLELLWVLESAYRQPREEILESITSLREMPILQFEADAVVQEFLGRAREGKTDLSDILIGVSASAHGCDKTMTFDHKAARLELFALLT